MRRRIPAPVLLALALAAIGLLALPQPASAERLITSLSTHRVMIASNFIGEELVLFGSIEREPGRTFHDGPYDVVAIVRGPRVDMVTRRKERVLGLWINVEQRQFLDVPAYLYILSNRNLDEIANGSVRDRLQLGLEETVLTQRVGADFADTVPTDPFRIAFLRQKTASKLYAEMPQGVTFLTPTLFRATIPLPANVRTGAYEVDVRVFGAGAVVARDTSPLEIVKVGFEETVARAARENGLLYGVLAALLAVMTGWAASIIFRRD
jgi:uncharacterized protein (TIGR02186 family)